MTTSIQMAQECLKQDPTLAETQDTGQSFEGLEAFAQTIESGTSHMIHIHFKFNFKIFGYRQISLKKSKLYFYLSYNLRMSMFYLCIPLKLWQSEDFTNS